MTFKYLKIQICGYHPSVLLITIELPASWMNAGSCKHPITGLLMISVCHVIQLWLSRQQLIS